MSSLLEEFVKRVSGIVKRHPKGRAYDQDGLFHPNPVPIAPPVGFVRTKPLHEQIRDMVRSEQLRLEVEQAGAETFEDADDFDVEDDFDPRSPYEYNFDPPMAVPVEGVEGPGVVYAPPLSSEEYPSEPSKPGVGAAGAAGSQKDPPTPPAPSGEPPLGKKPK